MRRVFISILCITSLIFLFSGCGSQTSSSETDGTEVRPQETSTAEAVTQAATAEETTVQAADSGNSAETSSEGTAEGNASVNSSSDLISEEEAKSIALEDAGVQESEVTGLRIKLETEDGIQAYDVDFYVDSMEYDYDINASTGEIISKDAEIEDDFQDNTSSSNQVVISEDEAIEIALKKVSGATEQDIYINLDYEDGRQVYEGSIVYGGMEYDFEIDAETGDVLEWEQEKED